MKYHSFQKKKEKEKIVEISLEFIKYYVSILLHFDSVISLVLSGLIYLELITDFSCLFLKVHPSSLSIDGTLGNFRLRDMSLGEDNCWAWLCDIRNPDVESLIKVEITQLLQSLSLSLSGFVL